jgi:hypothetical protein
MRLVGPVDERTDDPDAHPLQNLEGMFGKLHHIGGIGQRSESKAERCTEAMALFEGDYGNAPDHERLAVADDMRDQCRLVIKARTLDEWLEHIGKASPDHLQRLGIGVSVERRVARPVDRPKIVDPVQVIRMRMCINNGINSADTGGDQLLAEFRRGVDKKPRAVVLNQNRGSRAPVLRIARIALSPASVDGRRSTGSARTEDPKPHAAFAFVNRRKKFSVVACWNATLSTPMARLISSAV